jgi:hypothetical protein
VVKTESKPVRKSKLEAVIERRTARAVSSDGQRRKLQAREEARKERKDEAEFRKNFKPMFARLRRLVKVTFDKWNSRTAKFTYKGEQYSVEFEKWHSEGYGVDGYDTNGTHWALHRWCGGWHGDAHGIVDSNELKPGKDYSGEVIRMLADMEKNPGFYGYRNS